MSEKMRERPQRSKELPKASGPKKTEPPVSEKSSIDEISLIDASLNLPPFPSSPTTVESTPTPSSEPITLEKKSAVPILQNFQPFPSSASVSPMNSTESRVASITQESDDAELLLSPQIIPEGTANITADKVYASVVSHPSEIVKQAYDQLNTLEKEVLDIAETILKKKKFDATLTTQRVEMMSPLVEELYSKCIAKLTHTRGFSKEDIFASIQSLQKNLWLVTEQRRTKEEIISNPVLTRILNFIHLHPGTHARDNAIETELGISRNPFIKHVTILESFGLIRSHRIGRTENYFSSTTPDQFDELKVLFENPLVPQTIQFILDDPNVSLSELARRLNVYHGAIQYHLKALGDMNILYKDDSGYQVNREILRRYNTLYKIPPFRL
jgi:predicted transcriptional regulator